MTLNHANGDHVPVIWMIVTALERLGRAVNHACVQ